ncbi:hypothetical protein EK904_007751, partial [Melospiza melodia maxima]
MPAGSESHLSTGTKSWSNAGGLHSLPFEMQVEARTQIVFLLRGIPANVMFSFQILVGYPGRNWKCRVCVLWELLGLQQGASEKLGTEILLRAQAVAFW